MSSSVPDPTARGMRATNRRSATFAEKQPTSGPPSGPSPQWRSSEDAAALAAEWRVFGWVATGIAILTAPAFFLALYRGAGTRLSVAIVVTILGVLVFRGLVDLVTRHFIPRPVLTADSDPKLREEDHLARRRAWFWSSRLRFVLFLIALYVIAVAVVRIFYWITGDGSTADAVTAIPDSVPTDSSSLSTILVVALSIPLGLLINSILFIGPLVIIGLRQVKGYEPGETDWGVRLADVRGQAEPKEEIRKIVELWQTGDEFEESGGKRERGALFLGPPGTGKTMTAKAIATEVNSPFVSVSAAAFAQAFIGVDVIMVLNVAWRARRLARRWGGQCIVFIDEIDAVGLTRGSVDLTPTFATPLGSIHDECFFGPVGAITPSGDLVVETAAWRDRLFAERAEPRRTLYPAPIQRFSNRVRGFLAPGMAGMGGSGALQTLLVTMDGIEEPKPFSRHLRNMLNRWLDVVYIVPRRVGRFSLRLPPAKPRDEQIFFVGACNVALEALDPALTRPGRLGRHVRYRTPSKDDRKDILDLYLGKVAHDPELDSDARRDELARVTAGHSPAMIQQVCSLGLAYAYHDGRPQLGWSDLLEAITTVEAGIDAGLTYMPDEARSIAIHEAGHAVTGHVFMKGHTSTRLTIRPRGWSLGQHAMGEVDERYSRWRHEKFADLVWSLGAMASEYVFYGESTTGVGGDIHAATTQAALMVGTWGMAPRVPAVGSPEEEAEVMARYEALGTRLMNRAYEPRGDRSSAIAATLDDDAKRAMVAQFLGQAFATAYWFVRHNRDATARVADALVERREMYGDEVVGLLESLSLTMPDVDPRDEAQWPRI